MKAFVKKTVPYAGILLLVMLSYLFCRGFNLQMGNIKYVRALNLLFQITGLFLLIKECFRKEGKEGYTEGQIAGLILMMGICMRVVYMLYTPCDVREHDLWKLELSARGHASYILHMLQGKLPQDNIVQFYQQPLYYMLGAFASRILNGILGAKDAFHLVDAAKTVSCTASCMSLLISHRIFKECGLEGKGLYTALLLAAFLPVYFLTGGRVGPDALSGMFMLLAFLYTLRWIREKSWKNTLLLSLIYGFGMMTKISMATLAIFTAVIFGIAFYRACRNGGWKGLLKKYLVFGAVSLPIGLWYSLRNYLLFGQSLTYVLDIGKDNVMYKGNVSVWQRLFVINARNLFTQPYANVVDDYNLPVYALKSSLFGEFSYGCPGWIPVVLLFFAAIQACACVWAACRYLKGKEKDRAGNLSLLAAGIYWLSIMGFCLRHPFGCSMDFRYMLFLPIPIAVIYGRQKNAADGSPGMGHRMKFLWAIGFALSSCLMFG